MAKSLKLLVHHIPKSSEACVVAKFSDSLVDILQRENVGSVLSENEVKVSCHLSKNRLVLSAPSESKKTDAESYSCGILARPPFCPIKQLDKNQLLNLSPQTRVRGVNVGVAMLFESADNNILLTKRASSMRTFPNVWVPPGGHIDRDETFEEAAFREAKEEIGISFNSANIVSDSRLLGLWESVYPPWLISGLPKRHHVVIYLHVKGKQTAEEVNSLIKLQQNEVNSSAWICPCRAREIVRSDPQFSLDETCGHCNDGNTCQRKGDGNLCGTTVQNEETVQTNSIPFQPMLSMIKENMLERVSTGTKFALKLWLETLLKTN